MVIEKTKTGQALVNVFNTKYKHLNVSETYLWQLGFAHDLLDVINVDAIMFARAIKEGGIGHTGLDNLPQDVRHRIARDLAWHDVQMPLTAGDLSAYTKTKMKYKPSNESKALSNLHRYKTLEQFYIK
jgi:hypothetical protein